MNATRTIRTSAAASFVLAAAIFSALSAPGAADATQPVPDHGSAVSRLAADPSGRSARDVETLLAQRHHLMTAVWFAGLY